LPFEITSNSDLLHVPFIEKIEECVHKILPAKVNKGITLELSKDYIPTLNLACALWLKTL